MDWRGGIGSVVPGEAYVKRSSRGGINQGIPCVQRPYGGIYLITGPGMST